MMRIFLAVTGLVISLLHVASAQAQWVYNSSGGEFDGDALHYAFVGSGDYGIGLRCKSKSIDIIFVTRDKSFTDDSKFEVINMMKPILKYKLDGGSIHEIEGQLQNGDTGLAFMGTVTSDDAKAFRDAKKSVAVVISVMGQNYHETKFSMSGSTNAIGSVISGCGID